MSGELIVLFKSHDALRNDWRQMFANFDAEWSAIWRQHELIKAARENSSRTLAKANAASLSLFVPMNKVDAKQRIIYGTAVMEEPDRAGEIFDYVSSKPEFEKWSGDVEKSTDGKSKGNVRAMHGKVAAGKLTEIGFDDERKAIDVAAKIVDEDEWKKVEEGVYTGFSIGGSYLKRWKDGEHTRYTASPAEISLVDMPCVTSATFTMIKGDGSEELRKFRTLAEDIALAKLDEAVRMNVKNDDLTLLTLTKIRDAINGFNENFDKLKRLERRSARFHGARR